MQTWNEWKVKVLHVLQRAGLWNVPGARFRRNLGLLGTYVGVLLTVLLEQRGIAMVDALGYGALVAVGGVGLGLMARASRPPCYRCRDPVWGPRARVSEEAEFVRVEQVAHARCAGALLVEARQRDDEVKREVLQGRKEEVKARERRQRQLDRERTEAMRDQEDMHDKHVLHVHRDAVVRRRQPGDLSNYR